MALTRGILLFALLSGSSGPVAAALCGNGVLEAGEACDDGSQNGGTNSCCSLSCALTSKKPDVVVGDLTDLVRVGTTNGITAYGVGTESCNLGSCWLNWFQDTPDHPVIAQNMYRLKDGRLEQIGQSWLKHGFAAVAGSLCGTCVTPPDYTHLGVSCSDPYSAGLNAEQGEMGPRSSVNPTTGVFPYPDPAMATTGDVIFKRLQVHNLDLDPATNPGALYFVEGQYITRDDSAAGNGANNASYRKVLVGAAPTFNLTFDGGTERQLPGVHAWKAADPTVTETAVQADGRFVVAAKATSLGGSLYHYEYAVQNLNSHRAGQAFSVPLPPGTNVSNVGFHDVDYHSGEPYDGTDWTSTVTAGAVTWATVPFATNPDANALRWGTLYNFRFDADVGPGLAGASLGLFRPGSSAGVMLLTVAPGPCTQAPDEVDGSLRLTRVNGSTSLTWTEAPGSTWSVVLRGLVGLLPVGPGGRDEVCLGTSFTGSLLDGTDPPPGVGYWYVVQGRNACGHGSWGDGRVTSSCP